MQPEMINKLVAALYEGNAISATQLDDVRVQLSKFWEDKIALIWTTEDVATAAGNVAAEKVEPDRVYFDIQDDTEWADTARRELLQDVLANHDAGFGVSWDNLETEVRNFADNNLTGLTVPADGFIES